LEFLIVLCAEQLIFEQLLFWLSQVGASVAYSQRFCDLLDEIMEVMHPDWLPEYRQHDLNRRRACLAQLGQTPIWVNYLNPGGSIWVLPHGWFDPRENLDGQNFNDQPTWIGFRGMEEFYDRESSLLRIGFRCLTPPP
jgi:hypothetical protein